MSQLVKPHWIDREIYIHRYHDHKPVDAVGLALALNRLKPQNKISVVTDMDGTMISGDLGTAALMELFEHDRFYTLPNYNFEANLLSNDVKVAYSALQEQDASTVGVEGSGIYITDSKKLATWVMQSLVPRIIFLYKNIGQSFFITPNDVSAQSKREKFKKELKVLFDLLDLITIKLEPLVRGILDGRIISKVRMFAQLDDSYVKDVLTKLFENSPTSDVLSGSIVAPKVLKSIEGATISQELLTRPIDIGLSKVSGIRRFLRLLSYLNSPHLFADEAVMSRFNEVLPDITPSIIRKDILGSVIRVITTNSPLLAIHVVTNPPYGPIFEQCLAGTSFKSEDLVFGTRLARCLDFGVQLPEVDGEPVLRDAKRHTAEKVEAVLALGDTNTDTGMMEVALDNGGFACLVGPSQDSITAYFDEWVQSLPEEQQERVLYICSGSGGVRY